MDEAIVERFDIDSHRIYYLHPASGRTAWAREELEGGAAPAAATAPASASDMEERYDAGSQRTYFLHTPSGRTAWTREELLTPALVESDGGAAVAAGAAAAHSPGGGKARGAAVPMPAYALAAARKHSDAATEDVAAAVAAAAAAVAVAEQQQPEQREQREQQEWDGVGAAPGKARSPMRRGSRRGSRSSSSSGAHVPARSSPAQAGALRSEGHLLRKGRAWARAWFVLDRGARVLRYYSERSERGGGAAAGGAQASPPPPPHDLMGSPARRNSAPRRGSAPSGPLTVGAAAASAASAAAAGGASSPAPVVLTRELRGAISLEGAVVRPTAGACELEVVEVAAARTSVLRAESEPEYFAWLLSLKAATGQDTLGTMVPPHVEARLAAGGGGGGGGDDDAQARFDADEAAALAERATGARAGNHMLRNVNGGVRRSSMVGALSGMGDDPLLGVARAAAGASGGGGGGGGGGDDDVLPSEAEYASFEATLRDAGLNLIVHPRGGGGAKAKAAGGTATAHTACCTLQEIRGKGACLTWGGRMSSADGVAGRVGGSALPLLGCDVTAAVGAFASAAQRRASTTAPGCFFALVGATRAGVFEAPDAAQRDGLVRCFRVLLEEVAEADGASPVKHHAGGGVTGGAPNAAAARRTSKRLSMVGGGGAPAGPALTAAALAAAATMAAPDAESAKQAEMAAYFASATHF